GACCGCKRTTPAICVRASTSAQHSWGGFGSSAQAVAIAERADLAAMLRLGIDHRPEDAPCGPPLAPVGGDVVVEAGVVDGREVLGEQAVALFQHADRLLGSVRMIERGPAHFPRAERV